MQQLHSGAVRSSTLCGRRAVLRSAFSETLTTVPVLGATFRPDHVVLLAERPPIPHAVIDVNDSTALSRSAKILKIG